jgi:hypothetical protein
MSRFHEKYHRQNHHTNPSSTNPDSAHDPIASYSNPFQGDFVLQGGLSSTNTLSAVGGLFLPFLDNFAGNNSVTGLIPVTVIHNNTPTIVYIKGYSSTS